MRSPTCSPRAGYAVTKEYCINDAGAQVDVLAPLGVAALPRGARRGDRRDPEGLYPGDYLEAGRQRAGRPLWRHAAGADEAEAMAVVRRTAIDAMMAMIREDLALLNVHHDVFFSEALAARRQRRGDHARRIADLTSAGFIYQGHAAAAEGPAARRLGGSRADFCSASTDVGDDIDRPLVKSDRQLHLFRRATSPT